MQKIECTALGSALSTYSSFKGNKMIQLLYDWQNNSAQKSLQTITDGRYPVCSEYEDHLYYIYCLNSRMKTKRKDL